MRVERVPLVATSRSRSLQKVRRIGGATLPRHQGGFTLMEIGLALLVSILVVAAVLGAFSAQRQKSQVQQTVTNMGALSEAAFNWAGTRPNFTGVSCSILSTYGVLPPAVGQCTGANAWGGDYTVAANAANASHLDVTVTQVPATAGQQLADKMAGQVTAATYNSGSSSFTVTF
jgi:type II secretory pathway pseudopilin PulG